MIKQTTAKQIETIEKQGENKFRRKSTAKTMRRWLLGWIDKSYREGKKELEMIFREVLNAYNSYHPETISRVELESWKGKSGIIDVIMLPDKIITSRMQKSNQFEEPHKVETTITKEEMLTLINVINKLDDGDSIHTRDIAMAYSVALGLGHSCWNEFFADRSEHNKLTNALGVLSMKGMISYVGGLTKVLKTKLTFQLLLD